MPTIQPRLLLVDDDPEERYLMQMAFSDIGWRDSVLYFPSAEALLHHLALQPAISTPTLVLLDYHMPGLNGGQLLRLLKKNLDFGHLPVAIYSSHLTNELEQELLHDGAIRCFRKAQNGAGATALAEDLCALARTSISA